jgi:catechol 2,3-dioxygenase-like lactoylglutathione lyase family enzyme
MVPEFCIHPIINLKKGNMRIKLSSVSIDDYDKALKFYTEILGFQKKQDVPMGPGMRWITVVSPDEPNGTELLLEPNATYPAMKALKESLVKDGVPFTAFQVDDIQKEYERLQKLGVRFTMPPTVMGPTTLAVLDDTCGNLIQIYQV